MGKQQLIEDAFLKIQDGILWEQLDTDKIRELKGVLEDLYIKAQDKIYKSNKYKNVVIKGANIG